MAVADVAERDGSTSVVSWAFSQLQHLQMHIESALILAQLGITRGEITQGYRVRCAELLVSLDDLFVHFKSRLVLAQFAVNPCGVIESVRLAFVIAQCFVKREGL